MKVRRIMVWLLVAGIAVLCLLCLILYSKTTYALGRVDLEMVFIVTNVETGEPIPNASIDLIAMEYKEKGLQQVIKLVTDTEGRARFVHENNSCEDVNRAFRETVTLIDLTWASANVLAKGYSPVKEMWLHAAKYDNKGYSTEGRRYRVEFNVPLHKRADN